MATMQHMQHILIISYISLAIVGVSLVLNIFGIYLIGKQRARYTNQSLIILHLSILQVLILSGILAYWISVLTKMDNSDGRTKWKATIVISSRITFLLMIAILTFDRLFSIKYSLRHRNVASKKRVNVALAMSWVSWVVSLSIISLLRKDIYLAVFSVVVTVMDCLLLLFILYTYFYIYWRLRMRHRSRSNILTNSQQTQSGSKQALRVSTAIIVAFAFLVLIPDVVVAIAGHILNNKESDIIMYTGILVNNCYYMTLPVTYIFLHREVRRLLRDIIDQYCCKKDRRRSNVVAIAVEEERVQVAMI